MVNGAKEEEAENEAGRGCGSSSGSGSMIGIVDENDRRFEASVLLYVVDQVLDGDRLKVFSVVVELSTTLPLSEISSLF